jgi:hypothetical protein
LTTEKPVVAHRMIDNNHQQWQLGQQKHHEQEQLVRSLQLLQQKQNEHYILQQQILEQQQKINAQLSAQHQAAMAGIPIQTTPVSTTSTSTAFLLPEVTTKPPVNILSLMNLLSLDTRCNDKRDGIYREEYDCSSFYICETAESKHRIHKFTCPTGLVFSMTECTCDWPKGDTHCITPLLSSFCRETGPDQMQKASSLSESTVSEAETLQSVYLLNQILASIPFSCKNKEIGLHRDALDCSKFYYCQRLSSYTDIVKHEFFCPDGLHFNTVTCQCDWSASSNCVNNNLNGGYLITSVYCPGSQNM